jgi:hypothetical protein
MFPSLANAPLVIYGRKDQSEKEFVRQVQEILAALLETQRSIPPEHTVDFSNPSHTFTRTSATLYLMLLQVYLDIISLLA